MANWKKLASGAAGAAGGDALNVEDVFSTYLYTGTGSAQTITNGIDLAGEGGLVWIKSRNYTYNNNLFDSERGTTSARYVLESNSTSAEGTGTFNVTTFNSDGFSLGIGDQVNTYQGYDYASWTFRKAPKFFDVVTWTGSGGARTLSHNLGSTPGCIIVKDTSNAGENWWVYHRGIASDAETDAIYLNSTAAAFDESGAWNDTAPTSTQFTVGATLNSSFGGGATYVAYLFAHNDGDGGFGPDGDADIIKCGSYTHSGSAWTEDLGFEPQFVISKNTTSTGSWQIVDNMRGLLADNGSGTAYARLLKAEVSNAENNGSGINITSTGLEGDGTGGGGSGTYIYIAIRRGPMAVPESATDVFAIDTMGSTGDSKKPAFRSNKPVDLGIRYYAPSSGAPNIAVSRLTNKRVLILSSNVAEDSPDNQYTFEYNNGWLAQTATISDYYSYMWSRAPNFFDVVCYDGNGTAGRNISHNLGVAPEMMWVKKRSGAANWQVYHSAQGAGKYSPSFRTDPFYSAGTGRWYNTTPTSSVFTVGDDSDLNAYGSTYVAYLFASLDGISKIGSYSGTGSNINVDCGFSSGARFVFIKRTDTEIQSTTHWYAWDSLRGIVSGNDPYMIFNDPQAQVTNTDYIDPLSSGFTVTSSANSGINASGGTYIFYAIA